MISDQLRELLCAYARTGVGEWKHLDEELQSDARHTLAGQIAEDQATVDRMLRCVPWAPSGGSPLFIPMPRTHGKFRQAFFAVLKARIETPVTFEALAMVGRERAVAYRFEPAEAKGSHEYEHVQMCRRVLGKELTVAGVPDWMPTSFPAFPLPSREPLERFLCLLISIHGYRKGARVVLQRVLAQSNLNERLGEYLARLKTLAGRTDV